jgi:hypothetical protein
MHTRIFNLLFLLLSNLFISVRAADLVIEGQGTLVGYPGTIYVAHKYRPICGTLAVGSYNGDHNIGESCRPALSQYRLTEDTFSLYALTGVRLSDTESIGSGTELCMCFSLADINSRKADMCIYVNEEGATSDPWYNIDGVFYSVGNYRLGRKALPGCFDINTEEVISSLDAAGDATHVQVLPTSTSSTTPTSTVSRTMSSSSSPDSIPQPTSQENSPGNTPPNANVSFLFGSTPFVLFTSSY